MRAKPPANPETGGGALDAIDQLYDRLVTWLYERQDVRRALPIANRLERLLSRFNPKADNIFIEECRSLVCEAQGDLESAIRHRDNEIRLIHRLHKISRRTESEAYAFSQYDYADLSERLDILAMLYHGIGNFDKAISTLQESKRLCASHGIKFDGETLLRDYQSEKRAPRTSRSSPRKKRRETRLRATGT
jgi:tetratricopeptide (TPR) repeat protein